MKASRVIVNIAMIFLIVFGWMEYFGDMGKTNEKYVALVNSARNFAGQKLYVKATLSYIDALSIKSSEETVWQELVDTSRMAYEEGSCALSSHISNLKSACYSQPSNVSFWKELFSYIDQDAYSSESYECANAAINFGVSDEEVINSAYKIIYSYHFKGSSYQQIITSPGGETAVYTDNHWGMLNRDLEPIYPLSYNYISPYGSGEILLVTDKWSHIVDEEGIAQEVLSEDIKQSHAYGNGYLPVFDGKESWYYIKPSDGSKSEKYEQTSSFSNGYAAVKKNSVWSIVDTEFEPAGMTFDDIKLYANGEYQYNGIFTASANGRYSLYSKEGKEICGLSDAIDADIYMGDLVAYKAKNGLWGYISGDGKIAIEPQFVEAKSFSGGLGAVKKGDKWGFINHTGRMVIDCQFSDVGYFIGKNCYVYLGEWQVISLNG